LQPLWHMELVLRQVTTPGFKIFDFQNNRQWGQVGSSSNQVKYLWVGEKLRPGSISVI